MGNQLQPGIEMDLLIAERVMGAEWVLKDDEQPEACPYLQHDNFVHYPKENQKPYFLNPSYGVYAAGMPAYSLAIGPAWDVIEQIYKDTNHWMLVSKRAGIYTAYQATGCADPDYGEWYAHGKTAAHAICLTALKVKGIN